MTTSQAISAGQAQIGGALVVAGARSTRRGLRVAAALFTAELLVRIPHSRRGISGSAQLLAQPGSEVGPGPAAIERRQGLLDVGVIAIGLIRPAINRQLELI